MTVMEKISEDVLARLRLSASAMDAYFASSPDVRRFHESATRLDRMEGLMCTVRDNTVDIGAGLTAVRAMTQVCLTHYPLLLFDRFPPHYCSSSPR